MLEEVVQCPWSRKSTRARHRSSAATATRPSVTATTSADTSPATPASKWCPDPKRRRKRHPPWSRSSPPCPVRPRATLPTSQPSLASFPRRPLPRPPPLLSCPRRPCPTWPNQCPQKATQARKEEPRLWNVRESLPGRLPSEPAQDVTLGWKTVSSVLYVNSALREERSHDVPRALTWRRPSTNLQLFCVWKGILGNVELFHLLKFNQCVWFQSYEWWGI